MTMEQVWGLAPGTKLIYHSLTTSSTGMVVREPVTAYFVSAGGKRVEIVRPGIRPARGRPAVARDAGGRAGSG